MLRRSQVGPFIATLRRLSWWLTPTCGPALDVFGRPAYQSGTFDRILDNATGSLDVQNTP